MKYYIAALLNDDGTRHPIDKGGGVSEDSALRVAIRLANLEKHDACVVELSSNGTERIVQTVRFREGEFTTYGSAEDNKRSERFMLAALPLREEAIAFIAGWLDKGRSVTLSPARMTAEPSVNIVASAH